MEDLVVNHDRIESLNTFNLRIVSIQMSKYHIVIDGRIESLIASAIK